MKCLQIINQELIINKLVTEIISNINMKAFLYKTIFVGLLSTLVNSNYSGPWDNQEDCDHPEKMKEKECFCYTTPENDFEYRHSSISVVSISAIFDLTRFIVLSYFPLL